jgi:hypothetical protein
MEEHQLMEEHRLLRKMETWSGRRPTQLAFEARGYSLHRAWQERVIGFCGVEQADLLNRYWDEAAIETMQSLGRGEPDSRKFIVQPRYRSRLLDELFLKRVVEEPFRSPPLIPCLFELYKRIYFDAEFREGEIAFFRSLRKPERERLGIRPVTWSGKKRDFIPFVDKFCTALGFKRRRNRWLKSGTDFDGELTFEVGVDTGGNPYCIGPPVTFRIYCENDPKFAFEIVNLDVFDRLIPGVVEYTRRFDDNDNLLLGGRAFIELFDVITGSFGACGDQSR